MSERSAGQESASPTSAETPAGGGDFYATAARSTAATRSTRGTSTPASDTGAAEQAEEKVHANEATRVSSSSATGSAAPGPAEPGPDSKSSGPARPRPGGSDRQDSPESTRATSKPKTASSAGASAGSAGPADSGEGVALAQGKPRGSTRRKAGIPQTRKARLRLSRVDPWSVMKTAFLFSIAAGIIVVVAVYVIWSVIGASGLLESIDNIVGSVLKSPGETTPFRVEQYVNTQKVMGVTALLAVIDAIIITALTTLASFLYNLAATMLGGLEVTLAED